MEINKITHEDLQKARRISRAIQEYLEMANFDGARSTDVYEYLCRKGIIERDRHQGIHFRRFLKKLQENNLLRLIPQCTCRPSKFDFNEWYFYRVSPNRQELGDIKQINPAPENLKTPLITESEINDLIEEYKQQIDALPIRNDKEYSQQELEIRSYYPRAFEYWTRQEIVIMVNAYKKFNRVDKVAELLRRQPSAVKMKLKET